MNSKITKNRKDNLDNFKAISNRFVGLKAMLFAYSPGLQELEILFEKDGKYFILKFVHTLYVKTYKEWVFGGLKVEINMEGIQKHRTEYKFMDGDYFEVICLFAGVSEIVNGREVLNYEGFIDI